MNRTQMRRALVTGGAKGIGRAIVKRLASDGYAVAFTYHSDAAAAATLLDEHVPHVSAHALDVRDAAACEALLAELGGTDVLVLNAAAVHDQFLRFAANAEWHAMLDTNLTGSFHLARAAAPGMRVRRWGRVIPIGSYVGRAGAAGRVGYSASKAGLEGLTRALARELAPDGVTVNAVCPGLILTERTRNYAPRVLESAVAATPLGRAGTPEEVASLVRFLASDDASYLTGQVLSIDGGLFMRDAW